MLKYSLFHLIAWNSTLSHYHEFCFAWGWWALKCPGCTWMTEVSDQDSPVVKCLSERFSGSHCWVWIKQKSKDMMCYWKTVSVKAQVLTGKGPFLTRDPAEFQCTGMKWADLKWDDNNPHCSLILFLLPQTCSSYRDTHIRTQLIQPEHRRFLSPALKLICIHTWPLT